MIARALGIAALAMVWSATSEGRPPRPDGRLVFDTNTTPLPHAGWTTVSEGGAAGLLDGPSETGRPRWEVEWVLPNAGRVAPAIDFFEPYGLNAKIVELRGGTRLVLFSDDLGLRTDLWLLDETGAYRPDSLAGDSVSDIASDGDRVFVRTGSEILRIADGRVEERWRFTTSPEAPPILVASGGLYVKQGTRLSFWGRGEEPRHRAARVSAGTPELHGLLRRRRLRRWSVRRRDLRRARTARGARGTPARRRFVRVSRERTSGPNRLGHARLARRDGPPQEGT